MKKFEQMGAMLLIFFIRFYQKTISLDHGIFKVFYPNGYCRFYPSCSEYSAQALRKKGLWIGTFLTFKRILRCNPWSEGGVDEVK